jgi:hypothetical protein
MIRKCGDEIKAKDKFSQAGLNAERQMAFYLKSAFENSSRVDVLNNLRLVLNGDATQIDHLIIHKYGMIIIESKSITGKVTVNALGEWSRQYDGLKGIPSPVKQGERQAAFLIRYLNEFGPLVPAALGLSRSYDKMPVDVLVAISDSAVIQRQRGSDIENVCKADLIPDKVDEIVQLYNKEKGLFSFSILPFSLNKEIIDEICEFLKNNHNPLPDEKYSGSYKLSHNLPGPPKTGSGVIPKYQGYCIRCRAEIKLDPKIPYCKQCYSIWKNDRDKEHEETYCHFCGRQNKSTLNKPCCYRCYELSKDTLEYYLVK